MSMTRALNYVDDDLIAGAAELPQRKKGYGWLKWYSAAACFCILAVAAGLLIPPSMAETAINETTVVHATATAGLAVVDGLTMNQAGDPPELDLPFLLKSGFTQMTSGELYAYYGIDLAAAIAGVGDFQETEGRFPHGLYDDGEFDMNHFAFRAEERIVEISIGRETNCCRYTENLAVNSFSVSDISGTLAAVFRCADTDCFYSVFVHRGCSLIVLTRGMTAREHGVILRGLLSQ